MVAPTVISIIKSGLSALPGQHLRWCFDEENDNLLFEKVATNADTGMNHSFVPATFPLFFSIVVTISSIPIAAAAMFKYYFTLFHQVSNLRVSV